MYLQPESAYESSNTIITSRLLRSQSGLPSNEISSRMDISEMDQDELLSNEIESSGDGDPQLAKARQNTGIDSFDFLSYWSLPKGGHPAVEHDSMEEGDDSVFLPVTEDVFSSLNNEISNDWNPTPVTKPVTSTPSVGTNSVPCKSCLLGNFVYSFTCENRSVHKL